MLHAPMPRILLTENHKRLLWRLRRHGPQPRISLAGSLGLANGLVTRLARDLQALGMIEEEAALAAKSRGRPTVPLRISNAGGYAAGVICQPGWIEISLVDFAGHEFLHDSTPFDDPSPRAFANRLQERLAEIAGRLGMQNRLFLGLGIAAPGYVNGPSGRRWVVDWLNGWRDLPLEQEFSHMLGLPVWVENDASVAALAEFYQPGVLEKYSSALVLFLGHGLGGGVIADSDLMRGEYGNAGEVGRLFPITRAKTAPRPTGIDLLATMQLAGVAIDSLAGVSNYLVSHAALFEAWMDRVAVQLAQAIAAGTAWLDPGLVVISGALPTPLLDGLAARLQSLETDGFKGPVPDVRASKLGSASVSIGAAMLPIHAMTKPVLR
jgi:predicted NBD/HSP70 family sugar kinase